MFAAKPRTCVRYVLGVYFRQGIKLLLLSIFAFHIAFYLPVSQEKFDINKKDKLDHLNTKMEPSELDLIVFDKSTTSDQEMFEIKQKNTVIVRNATENHMSSSKVKLKNIVDYKWELKPYNGRLVAAHKGGNIIAYTIKGKILLKCFKNWTKK